VNDRGQYSIVVLKERLLAFWVFRVAFLSWSLVKAAWHQARGNAFEAADSTLYYSRILSVGTADNPLPVSTAIHLRNAAIVRKCLKGSPQNYLLESYVQTHEAEICRQEFAELGVEWARALKHPRPNDRPDREGDLLVLKPYLGARERGVILVCYNASFRRFAALYDLPRLAERYRFVLEPSTWGYEDATLLMFVGLPTDVVIQSQHRPDYDYIRRIGGNIHAIDLGAGDWVDPDAFNYDPRLEKHYDIAMVASWLTLKRHELLFRALRPLRDQIGRVALIGYSFAGRTKDDIKREAARYGVLDMLDIYEKIPFDQVSELLQQSRMSVMLSRREGASRAVYESFFANTPVLVSKDNVGINRDHINERTGIFSSDEELSSNLLSMTANSDRYDPRAWALENTGYCRSSHRLNAVLKNLAMHQGEAWTADLYHKKNRHNAMYSRAEDRAAARNHLEDLGVFLRPTGRGNRTAS
jgi:glycosyltransferase involved in cell wall biosynthesis